MFYFDKIISYVSQFYPYLVSKFSIYQFSLIAIWIVEDVIICDWSFNCINGNAKAHENLFCIFRCLLNQLIVKLVQLLGQLSCNPLVQ